LSRFIGLFQLSKVKKVLAYLSPERHCSLFDIIVAHDAGADVVIPYSNVCPGDVKDIVYGCCFTRHPRDLRNSCIFVGGYSIEKAEELASEALRVLNGLPKELRVNIALDPNGAYTTASACVAKIRSAIKVENANTVVLAGTGPVGCSTARLLADLGANVLVSSRNLERAERTAKAISKKVYGTVVDGEQTLASAVRNADVVVSAGPPAVELLPRKIWANCGKIKVLTDINVVPPYGIEGVKPKDDGTLLEGRKCYGALAIGVLKMKLHQMMIKQMFKEKGSLFNLKETYGLHESCLLR